MIYAPDLKYQQQFGKTPHAFKWVLMQKENRNDSKKLFKIEEFNFRIYSHLGLLGYSSKQGPIFKIWSINFSGMIR